MLAKLKDGPGLAALGGQIILDLTVLCFLYLPCYYTLKAGVFNGENEPKKWLDEGLTNCKKNWTSDAKDVCKTWGTADLICFSVPLYLRLPIRHVFSFGWTSYFSLIRGANKP